MHTAANLFDALKEGYTASFRRRRNRTNMRPCKIDKKIVKYRVEKPEDKAAAAEAQQPRGAEPRQAQANVIRMHEKVERPEMLIGSTYKIKTPVFDHAMYVTINDIVLNEGTEHEQRRPFEIFINSKNLDHFQWIVALTRIISAVFRKGGDVTFLVEEMKAVFDPRGGYWQAGGKFMPSIIAELGYVIEKHLQTIGLLEDAGARRAPQEAHGREARGVRGAQPSSGCVREEPFPGGRAAVRQVQHRGRRA